MNLLVVLALMISSLVLAHHTEDLQQTTFTSTISQNLHLNPSAGGLVHGATVQAHVGRSEGSGVIDLTPRSTSSGSEYLPLMTREKPDSCPVTYASSSVTTSDYSSSEAPTVPTRGRSGATWNAGTLLSLPYPKEDTSDRLSTARARVIASQRNTTADVYHATSFNGTMAPPYPANGTFNATARPPIRPMPTSLLSGAGASNRVDVRVLFALLFAGLVQMFAVVL